MKTKNEETRLNILCDAKDFDIDKGPFSLFREWQASAEKVDVDPTAGALATCDAKGMPTVRFVLMKKLFERDEQVLGPAFYTNFNSLKGKQLAENPRAALTFYWPILGRQVRFEGVCEKMTSEESMAYFQSRPRDSQIASLVSEQSRPVAGRQEIEQKFSLFKGKDEQEGGTRPLTHEHWGGHIIIPTRIEFFLYKNKHRLGDRFNFTRSLTAGDSWQIERLWP